MYIYIYIPFFYDLNVCILHKCSAMLQIVDVFKCFWLTLMESYGKYVEITVFVSMKIECVAHKDTCSSFVSLWRPYL